MTVAEIIQKMIAFSNGNLHDIDHFIKVWTYARTIGKLEGLADEQQFILETAAVLHDIACPLCREKYGNTDGKNQEKEGPALAASFLEDAGLTEAQTARIIYLVGHHHTLTEVDGIDYQILLEADYIVNAGENAYPRENVENFLTKVAKTSAGSSLLKSIYGI